MKVDNVSSTDDLPLILNGLDLNDIEAVNNEWPEQDACVDFYHKLSLVENLFSWPG